MKKPYIFSAILGGTFFAVPYLALNVEILPAVAIGAAAYGAGMLVFKNIRKDEKLDISLEDETKLIKESKENTAKLKEISKLIENQALVENINIIYNTSNKIISAIEKEPTKIISARNFLNYYLPVTIKILSRYDEIENQRLSTQDSQKFMQSIQNLIEKIKNAFEIQLNNMYQSEMIDTDAEIKVFEEMLKSDGFIDDMQIKKQEK